MAKYKIEAQQVIIFEFDVEADSGMDAYKKGKDRVIEMIKNTEDVNELYYADKLNIKNQTIELRHVKPEK